MKIKSYPATSTEVFHYKYWDDSEIVYYIVLGGYNWNLHRSRNEADPDWQTFPMMADIVRVL